MLSVPAAPCRMATYIVSKTLTTTQSRHKYSIELNAYFKPFSDQGTSRNMKLSRIKDLRAMRFLVVTFVKDHDSGKGPSRQLMTVSRACPRLSKVKGARRNLG
jgi:hypothetical protein